MPVTKGKLDPVKSLEPYIKKYECEFIHLDEHDDRWDGPHAAPWGYGDRPLLSIVCRRPLGHCDETVAFSLRQRKLKTVKGYTSKPVLEDKDSLL